MTTKLTLTVEETVIGRAKAYAKQTDRSLSELVESYLESLIQENPEGQKLSARLKRLVGSVKLPGNFNEKEELRKALEKKHL